MGHAALWLLAVLIAASPRRPAFLLARQRARQTPGVNPGIPAPVRLRLECAARVRVSPLDRALYQNAAPPPGSTHVAAIRPGGTLAGRALSRQGAHARARAGDHHAEPRDSATGPGADRTLPCGPEYRAAWAT